MSDKAYSVESRLNAIIGLIYADGANQVSIGTAAQGKDLQLYDLAGTPAAPTQGTKFYSSGGFPLYASEDGNQQYEMGVRTVRTSGTQLFNSATPATVAGLQVNIGAPGGSQDYAFEWWVDLTADSSTFLGFLFLGGTATISTVRGFVLNFGNGVNVNYRVQNVFNSPTGFDFGLNSGTNYLNVGRGHVTCTAAGTLNVGGATSGGDGFTTHIRSLFRVWPTVS